MDLSTKLMPINVFVWCAIFVCKSINDYITNILTEKI